MKIRFWGVRGSIPCPGPTTVEYGGNTACIELRFGDNDRLLIIDAGSGIRSLGNYMMQHDLPKGPIETSIFLTHTHWDHIMGFPFFTPIYIPNTKLKIYGPVTYENEGLDKIVGSQLSYRYFPIKHSELSAEITYYPLKESSIDLGDGITVTTKYLNHPILCLGYKFEHEGKVFCTAYDTEPYRNIFPTNPEEFGYDEVAAEEGDIAAREENEKLLRFMEGADIVVHDTQYTNEEYVDSKLGWGHTPFEFAINSCNKAGVKKMMLF
ncbi:MAG: MBL fold metallo-hydrolase, partial [Spirochaetales bacterium]|nr:MBL fold metallo-hydrolase [Spirochaetales bacterium]